MGTDGLRIARGEAAKSKEEFMLGACVVKNGRVLGRGYNQLNKTNALVNKFFQFPTLHAEVAALARLDPDDVKGAIVYVYRIKRHCDPGLARPCEKCAEVLAKFGVKRVIYSTEEAPYFEVVSIQELRA